MPGNANSGTRPPVGEALRSRIAAQADAAFAAGPDSPIRQLLAEPDSREQKKEQLATAEKLLLERPKSEVTDEKVEEEEAIDIFALRKAAEAGDLKALAQIDKRLKDLLDSDERMRVSTGKDLADPAAKAAMRLYRESFMALERKGSNIDKEAFQAIMRDDAVKLTDLLGQGLDKNARNPGGHTLLQLAQERGKVQCAQVLVDAGAEASTSA
eukprot:TRINITY_DN53158_c0_g1_i1.p1 TRINITY_DN53158_c0_g1~~TRINITY_DN53158_c0_g1_i1.p1  ORF type:complete len:212 (+),score=74.91 TRINITY_DN53158_c0_g1_i1:20-655(+)